MGWLFENDHPYKIFGIRMTSNGFISTVFVWDLVHHKFSVINHYRRIMSSQINIFCSKFSISIMSQDINMC